MILLLLEITCAVLDFVNILLEKCGLEGPVHALSHYLAELVLQDGQYTSAKPSLVATAVVTYARLCSNGNNFATAWDTKMQSAFRYSRADVFRYAQVPISISRTFLWCRVDLRQMCRGSVTSTGTFLSPLCPRFVLTIDYRRNIA